MFESRKIKNFGKGGFLGFLGFLVGLLVVGLVIAFAFVSDNSSDLESQASSNVVFEIGQVAEFESRQFVVNSVDRGVRINSGNLVIDDSKEFVKIGLTLKNYSGDLVAYSFRDFYLQTDSRDYDSLYPPAGSVPDFIFDGKLSKNGQITASIYFLVDKDLDNASLVFVPQFLFGGEGIVVENIL